MQWIRDLSVSRKFTFAFGIVCGLCILLGVYTVMTFRSIARQSAAVSDISVPSPLTSGTFGTASMWSAAKTLS